MRTPKKQKRKVYAVDFYEKGQDFECALYGVYGYSNNYIESQTGLTTGQINYRMKLSGISRRDIRNGKSQFAKLVFNATLSAMDDKLMAHLRKHL